MKASMHAGRTTSKGKAYNVNHNDRKFEQNKSVDYDKHIDKTLFSNNKFYRYKMGEPKTIYRMNIAKHDLRDIELAFYEKHFKKHLEAQNERHIKSRHKERCKSIEDIYTSPRTCPQETILQVGRDGEYQDLEKFDKMIRVFCVSYNNVFHANSMIIDCAIHADETSLHAHIRRVFYVKDKDGNLELAQNKALEQMGYDLPNPTQKRSKYNNRLQAFTDEMRGFWQDIIEHTDKSIKIDREPISSSQRHLEKLDYQNVSAKNKLEALIDEKDRLSSELEENKQECDLLQERLERMRDDAKQLIQVSNFAKEVLDEEAQLSYSIRKSVLKNDTIIQNVTPEQVKEVFELSANMTGYLEQQRILQEKMKEEVERKELSILKRERKLDKERKEHTLEKEIEIAKAVADATNEVRKEKNWEIKELKGKLESYVRIEKRFPEVKQALELARKIEMQEKLEKSYDDLEYRDGGSSKDDDWDFDFDR